MKLRPSHIEQWVSKHFEYRKKSRGKQLVINNPFDGDTGWHFWINLEPARRKKDGQYVGKPTYWVHDFRPGHQRWDGSFIKFVQTYKNLTYYEAIKEVCGSASDARSILQSLRELEEDKREDLEEEPEEKLLELPEDAKPLFGDGKHGKARKIATSYLKKRMITPQAAKANFIHYTATSIVFPYIEYGMVVYWQERSIITKQFRFPSESETGLAKTDFVYGFDGVEPNGVVYITEAIFDALTVGSGAIATGGADLAASQVRKIRALNPSTIILAPDNDNAGVASMRSNYSLLRPYFRDIKYCLPPKLDDLNDWNGFDQKIGSHWSKNYIEKNVRDLNKISLLKPWIKNGI